MPGLTDFEVLITGKDPRTGTSNRQTAFRLAARRFAGPLSLSQDAKVGVSFDPDGAGPEQWRREIETQLTESGAVGFSATSYGWTGAGRELIAIPWTCTKPVLDGLPDLQALERLAVHAVAACEPGLVQLLNTWLEQLKGIDLKLCNWKAASLLWQAATHSKIPEASFFDKVFDQDPGYRAAALKLLQDEPVWPALQRLATP